MDFMALYVVLATARALRMSPYSTNCIIVGCKCIACLPREMESPKMVDIPDVWDLFHCYNHNMLQLAPLGHNIT
jgi:hypothetical protein